MNLSDFHFIRPIWLLLAPVAIWIWWLTRRTEDPLRGWRSVMEPELLRALTVGGNAGSLWTRVGLLVAWLLATLAIAGPTWRPEASPFADDPVPIMLVLKANETMNQADLLPTRMERARLKVADFAAERQGQPLGLVTYAGSAHMVLPPTRDTSVVAAMGAEVSPEIMPKQGDDLAAALEVAAGTLGDSGGSIVIIADEVVESVDDELGRFRSENGFPVFFLAVARDDSPELASVRRAASTLRAEVTLLSADSADVTALARRASRAPRAVQAAGEGTRWEEAGWWLVPLLALMSLSSFRRVQRETAGASE